MKDPEQRPSRASELRVALEASKLHVGPPSFPHPRHRHLTALESDARFKELVCRLGLVEN